MGNNSFLSHAFKPAHRKICISVIIFGVIIGCVLFAYAAFMLKQPSAEKLSSYDPNLKKVFIVFRHGDRTPTETYPNDPYVNYSWPGGWGVLTKKGMRQLYNLGRWLREEYGWITDQKYLKTNTVIESSYSDRCIESAQALLAGLYPPLPDEIFTKDLNWRPIAVHYVPRNLDKILVVKAPCPKLDAALKEAYEEDTKSNNLQRYFAELEKITGATMKTITDVEFLYNTLEIEVSNGLTLPVEIKKFYNSTMQDIAARSYSIFTNNKLQQRLRGGPLLKHILEKMKNRNVTEKMFLYSTHDINIVNTLRTMGFNKENFKLEFGASLIFELRSIPEEEESYQVRISFLNSTDSTVPHRLTIPGCKNVENKTCSLDELFQVWNDVIPGNWDEECKL